LIYIIFYDVFHTCFVAIQNKCCHSNKVKAFAKNQGTFTQELKMIEHGGLSTYDLLANDNYKGVYLAYADFTFNLGELRKKSLMKKVTNFARSLTLGRLGTMVSLKKIEKT
jgi:hypothetical protein